MNTFIAFQYIFGTFIISYTFFLCSSLALVTCGFIDSNGIRYLVVLLHKTSLDCKTESCKHQTNILNTSGTLNFHTCFLEAIQRVKTNNTPQEVRLDTVIWTNGLNLLIKWCGTFSPCHGLSTLMNPAAASVWKSILLRITHNSKK